MRMVHYYLAFALLAVPALLATAWTGATFEGGGRHFAIGLSTAIFCVALNTLVILFMIVTGRVLKQAMKSRPLAPEFLVELNAFFAEKSAYPVAVGAAFAVVTTAVLGYGSRIGVPAPVHLLFGIGTVLLQLWAAQEGYRALRANQSLLDRVASELDRMDAAGIPVDEAAIEPEWRLALRGRWFVFAVAAWAPYVYWGAIAWNGDFARLPRPFLVGTVVASLWGLWNGLRTPVGTSPEVDDLEVDEAGTDPQPGNERA